MGNFYMREDGVRRTEFGLLRKLSDPFLKYKMGCRCINPCTQIQDTLWNQHEWENTVNMGGIK